MQLNPTLAPLPCPFCGEIPVVGPADPQRDGSAWGWVVCVNVACAVRPKAMDGEDCADERGSGAYKDVAIRRWNTRPSTTADHGVDDEVRETFGALVWEHAGQFGNQRDASPKILAALAAAGIELRRVAR